MLPLVDASTLFVASAVVFLGLAATVAIAWRELRSMKGPERFAASYALFFAGLVLFGLRGRIPDLLSMTVSNVLIVLGAAVVLEGTRLFYGLFPRRRVTLWLVGSSVAGFLLFTVAWPSARWRTILSSAFLAAIFGTAAWTSWRRRNFSGLRFLDEVTTAGLAGCALLFWARGVAVGSGLVHGEMLGGSPWLAVPPLVCTLCAVVWTTTLLANTSRRLTNVVSSQNDLLARLFSVARAAGDDSSFDATLERVLETAAELTGASGASLLMLDEEGRFQRGLFTHGEARTTVSDEEAGMILEKGLAGWVVRNRSTGLVTNVATDPRWHRIDAQTTLIGSALSAPISSGPALAGVLTLVHPEPAHFGDEEVLLLESTTAQIALALRNAQIADARLRATRGQALLNRVLDVSARETDASEIVRRAAEAIADGCDSARVYLAIPGEDGHFRLHGRTADLEETRPRIDEGILGRVLQTGRTQREDAPSGAAAEPGTWCRLGVPLRDRDRVLGVAAFESPRPRAFDDAEVELAEALAEAVSLGLGKAATSRAREELIRTMVHDLRGPVAGIMGALELLGDAPGLEESDREILAMAERNTRRQVELIDGILELARLEDGALPVRPRRIPVAGIVTDVLRMAKPGAEARRLDLLEEVPEDLPDVSVDPSLIGRVLENLVGNAIKFTKPATGPVRVSARQAGGMVELRVRDSGPGVEEALRPRLFQKFAAGTLAGRGTGLGLAFCRLVMEAHGGRIWLEEAGPGAVFAVSLPVAADD